MTYNVHQVLHLLKSVIDFGPLWSHSCFGPESNNGRLIRKIKSAKGVVNQVCRSVLMDQSFIVLKKFIRAESPVWQFCHHLENREEVLNTLKMRFGRYFGSPISTHRYHIEAVPEVLENPRCYEKMVKDRILYTSCQRPNIGSNNSIATLNDGTIIQIICFIVDAMANKEFVISNRVAVENSFADGSCDFFKKIVSIGEEIVAYPVERISSICVKTRNHVSLIPNLHHV